MRPSTMLLLLLVTTTAALSSSSMIGCLTHERDALLVFKQGITGDPDSRLVSWHEGEDCCRWRGVGCSNQTGHVIGLYLANVQDDRQLDPEDTALYGQISKSLLSLQNLQHLDLSMNNLSGPTAHVPKFLGLLKNLRYLDLSGIPFSGMVPPQLGNLSKLHTLYISPVNDFSMHIPNLYSTDISWLTNLPLRYLGLDFVNLSTQAHWATVVNMVPSLQALSLTRCSLTSTNQSLPHLNITDLEILDLSETNLYGEIPDALGSMTSLQFLGLSYCGVTDIITANLRNLCNLESLHLSYSKLNGNGDIIEFLDLLPRCFPNKLQELFLGGNNLTGELPNWIGHRWPSLLILKLYGNQLKGHVPSEIGMLKNLTELDLSNNNLTGVITQEHLAGLTSLIGIDLSDNSLKIVVHPEWLPPFRLQDYAYFASCHMGPSFPSWLRSQTDVWDLNITRASIVDRLPEWFFVTFSNAWRVDISNNGISGTLPTNFANLTSLEKVYVNSNNLYGPIPQLPTGLLEIVGSENNFSGPLPSDFGAQQLMFLNLASNRITGPIPQCICQLTDLVQLYIANNLLDGEFPVCLQPRRARILILRNNKLSGKLPSSLKAWKDLYILDLAWNEFSGRLPLWLGDFAQLKIVELSHNKFTGFIPPTITRLGSLSYLSLAGNCISGPLPHHFSNLTGMTRAHYAPTTLDPHHPISYYNPFDSFPAHVNLPVMTKGQERYYWDSEVYEIVSIDLSSNQLTGGIPEEITSLDGVLNLNLSWNQLSGKIPGKIGVMQSLESLDLKKNKLFGEIPQSMSSLTYLSVLDLAYNNLTGTIPSGGQLDTLYLQNPSIYDGNSGLCGHPLPKNCSDNSKHGVHKNDEDDSMVLSFSFGLGLGYVVGMWAVFCIVLFKQVWRIQACHVRKRS
ncbi:unnamed protein product [Urochloa decumbens]|uniref:Leucine-rich repeat-containing N-terminal plant-type domain-containing protein n=1 Tax=Urochloa decumbens TaxID=240449 RepID=A0ABC9B4N5_9POAL